MSNGIGHVWAVNAEGGDEGRPNGVGPVWIENADQLGSKLPEPASGDAGKVLGVLNSDGDIGWVPDQEGMAQVQADWLQDDPQQVSYIANKPTIPTVDQAYSASSANAQSGVAVAQAIAAIPSEVSSASGHFDIGGNVPVKVNYTGSSSTVISNVPLSVAEETNYQGVAGSVTHQINVFFDNTNGIQDLGTTYSGTLTCKVSSVLAGFPAGVVINGVSPLMYCQDNASAVGGPIINGTQFTISGGDIGEQTLSVSGANPAAGGGYGQLIGFNIGISNPNTADLTTELTSLINEIESGNVFELVWPSEVTGGLETTIPVVDQVYNASSTNAQSGTAVAGALATVDEVPAVTSSDDGKVLQATYSGGSGSYAWASPATVTVDQTYNSASTNAQSGVAVAQAIAAIPSASYSAGDGINITSGTISVDHDDTLSSAYRYETANVTSVSETYKAGIGILDGSLLDFVINDAEDPDATLKIHIPGNTFFSDLNNLVAAKVIIADTDEFDHNAYSPDATLSVTYDSQNHWYVIDEQDVEIKAFYQEWEPISGGLLGRATYLGFGFYTNDGPQVITPSYAAQVSSTTLTDPVVIDVPIPMANKLLSVANPVPAATSVDEGKVLTVDNAGAPGWQSVPKELPSSLGTAGQVLTVNSGATGVEWATPATVTVDQTYNSASTNAQSGVAVADAIATVRQLPASAQADAGKVLTVGQSGTPEWDTSASGGATLTQVLRFTSMAKDASGFYAGTFAKLPGAPNVTLRAGKLYVMNISISANTTNAYSSLIFPADLAYWDGSSVVRPVGGSITSVWEDATSHKLLFNAVFVPTSDMPISNSYELFFEFYATPIVGSGTINSVTVNSAAIYELS